MENFYELKNETQYSHIRLYLLLIQIIPTNWKSNILQSLYSCSVAKPGANK